MFGKLPNGFAKARGSGQARKEKPRLSFFLLKVATYIGDNGK